MLRHPISITRCKPLVFRNGRSISVLASHRPRIVGSSCSKMATNRSFSLTSLASESVGVLSEGVLSLGNLISYVPLPGFIGPYASGIILTTILVRTVVTVPFAVWAENRKARQRDIVVPEIIAWRKPFAKDLAKEAAKQKEEDTETYFNREFRKAAIAKRSELLTKHNCSPLKTALVPLAVHIPTFILTSLVIRNACQIPNTPLLYESLLSETALAFNEPTGVFPLLVGLGSLGAYELKRWLDGGRGKAREEMEWARRTYLYQKKGWELPSKPETKNILVKNAAGKYEVQKASLMITPADAAGEQKDSAMDKLLEARIVADPATERLQTLGERLARGGSIVFIWISMLNPGAVTLYWFTSSMFTMAQTLIAHSWDKRRKNRLPPVST
ncbi:hypothetical protein FRC03_002392 [Tulasnella sp. 419]|nr:hypothetical protein FRC03_002392 [Tulasnella sp. 419]